MMTQIINFKMLYNIRPKYIVFTRTIQYEDTLSNVHKIFKNITTTRKQEPRKQNAPERFQGCTKSPTYRHRRIPTENPVGVEKDYQTIKLNKPIYMDMSILDHSKVNMRSFFCDVLKPIAYKSTKAFRGILYIIYVYNVFSLNQHYIHHMRL